MEKNNILDYEQVRDKLKDIENNGIIKKEKELAITEHGLPIEHFTVGEGDKDIVITGATHGSEIITTDFVIKLMESINLEDEIWKKTLKEFKIHFIPMLNPEGYLISTSAIRKLITRDMPIEEAEKIYEKYPDLPKGVLQIWSANGNGIDIQANSEYNPKILNILANEKVIMSPKRFDNIDISHPGPINCPFDKEKGFKTEIETSAISDLLDELSRQGKLFLYLNYHSTGGMIFQRPAIPPEELDIPNSELTRNERVNFILSKAYASKTYKNKGLDSDGIDKKEKTRYVIKTAEAQTTSTNDIFRLKYPQDLLIELSGMGGNPIAPYGDIKGNYTNAIESNLDATKFTFHVASALKQICEEFSQKAQIIEKDADYETVTATEALIFDEFSKRIMEFESTKKAFDENKKEEGKNIDDDDAR